MIYPAYVLPMMLSDTYDSYYQPLLQPF